MPPQETSQATPRRSLWLEGARSVKIIDQRHLPEKVQEVTLETREDFTTAIREGWVRGAPLIGATAAYGIAKEMARKANSAVLDDAYGALSETLPETRPEAAHLRDMLDRMRWALAEVGNAQRAEAAFREAAAIWAEAVEAGG